MAVDRGALPSSTLTPGATWNVSVAELCATGTRELRPIPLAVRQQVLRTYGMEHVPTDQYQLDYLITPELGGAPDARNLWPQRYGSRVWNAHVKDDLERLLPRMVCNQEDPARDGAARDRARLDRRLPDVLSRPTRRCRPRRPRSISPRSTGRG